MTFIAAVAPTHGGTLKIPFKINQWRWQPDSGSVVTACPPPAQDTNPANCLVTPNASGTMEVDAVVNGSPEVEAKYVSVLTCLLGDTLLDDARIRRLLRAALDSSFPNAAPHARRERKFMRLLQPDGTIIDTLYTVGPTDTPCSINFPAQLGGVPILAGHTHPFEPFSADTLPYDPAANPRSPCPQLAGKGRGPHQSAYGASSNDIAQMPQGYPQLVVEKDGSVWVYPSNFPVSGQPKAYPTSGLGVCSPLLP